MKVIFSLFFLFILISCLKIDPSSNSKSIKPRGQLKVSTFLKKPHEIEPSQWVNEVERTIFKNQTTGFILTGEICKLNGMAQAILPTQINYPSAKEYSIGTYYDALAPLTEKNCRKTDYAFIDLNKDFEFENLKIKLNTLNSSSEKPQLNFYIQIEPFAYSLGLNKGVYRKRDEELVLLAHEKAMQHRIRPIKSWLEPYKEARHNKFESFVSKNGKTRTNIPVDGEISKLLKKNLLDRPWFYVWDEPYESEFTKLKKKLNELDINYPSVSKMVTTNYRPDLKIDIYCPVAEHIDKDSAKQIINSGSELWMYVSCMSHGCGPSREYTSNPEVAEAAIDYHKTGTPDLSIEADSQDIYMLYLMALKFPITGLLYYNSIEQWKFTKYGVDPIKDSYNFGGNGDGNIMYPDIKNQIPLLSLRMKIIREASFLYDAVIKGNSIMQFKPQIDSTRRWSFEFSKIQKAFQKLN